MRGFIRSVEKLTGQTKLKHLYEDNIAEVSHSGCFFEQAIKLLDLDIQFHAGSANQNLPSGPIIFIANHLYGVLDGIVFTWIAQRMRPDVKVMAN